MTEFAIALTRRVRRTPMLRGRTSAIATVALAVCGLYIAIRFVNWALVNAVWTLPPGTGSAACRAIRGDGACWAVIGERFRYIILGGYPFDQQWRPAIVCVLFVSLYLVSAPPVSWRPRLALLWIAVPLGAVVLLRGGLLGLSSVTSDKWGGLPLTFMLSTVGFVAAFPLAVVLALGRRSEMAAIRVLSVAYIEIVRGVPLITFLFMASLMFPLFVPQGITVDKLLRAQVAFVMVIAAYLAEVIRGGLQAIPKGQYEAAASMGLSFWPTTVLVVLPQALRITIPSIVSTFIGFFKDTSLVVVIGLFDLLGTGKAALVDPKWVGFGVEVYAFVGAIYFVFCFAVSRYSQHLERTLAVRSH
jgi:general L-amino acid transport system permease protein